MHTKEKFIFYTLRNTHATRQYLRLLQTTRLFFFTSYDFFLFYLAPKSTFRVILVFLLFFFLHLLSAPLLSNTLIRYARLMFFSHSLAVIFIRFLYHLLWPRPKKDTHTLSTSTKISTFTMEKLKSLYCDTNDQHVALRQKENFNGEVTFVYLLVFLQVNNKNCTLNDAISSCMKNERWKKMLSLYLLKTITIEECETTSSMCVCVLLKKYAKIAHENHICSLPIIQMQIMMRTNNMQVKSTGHGNYKWNLSNGIESSCLLSLLCTAHWNK